MRVIGALVFVAVLLLNSVAANAEYEVFGSGYSSMDYGITQTPFDITTVTNSDGSKSITGSGFNQQATIGSPVIISAFSGGSVDAYAGAGILRARIDTSALIAGVVSWQPQVSASVGAKITDTLLVESNTLVVGTPVAFTYTMHIDGQTNAPTYYTGFGYPQGTVYASFAGDGLNPTLLTWPPPFAPTTGVPAAINLDIPFTISTTVGSTLNFQFGLSLSSFNRANFGYGDTQRTLMDFSHTMQLFADPTTNNFWLSSQSGHNYATGAPIDPSPVPEPSTWILAFSFGLTALVSRRIRRRRAAT
ncbi:MAG TPA: PEP-CTERM sorting domain-containing protein [Planctomycetaceae bacterium]|nr:PEP-CTERM sorting domain-containing protein [Planctomycetaceae bacterium]